MVAAQKSLSSDGIRLTSQQVQKVLDVSVESCLGAGRDEILSQYFLEGLRQASGAAAVRVWEVWKTTVRLAGIVGTAPARGVTEKALRLRLVETQTGLREHSADELQPQPANSAFTGDSWRYFTITAELASGLQLLLEFCYLSPAALVECAESAGEIYADLRRRELVLQQRRFLERFGVMELLIQRLHEAPGKTELLQILATESGSPLGCYRVSVCERHEGRWRLAAAAGISELNERADEVRRICREVQLAEKPNVATETTPAGDVAGARPGVAVVPLSNAGNWSLANYALHLEYRGAGAPDLPAQERVIRHAVTALSHHSGGLAKAAGAAGKSRLRLWLGCGLAVVGIAAVMPQELTISAGGELQPLQRQSVYISESGVVEELLAADGSDVENGGLLLRLRNDELLLEQETLLGDLAAVRARLAAVDAVRAGRGEGQPAGPAPGEQAELAARSESLQRQLEIVERRLSALELRAPQAGRIIGEELRERFFGRPVLRGQHFCDVGDLQGSWELRLSVSEGDIRHVLESAASTPGMNADRPEVRFFLETNPDVFHSVRLATISGVTEVDRRGNSVIAVTAEVPAGAFEELRPGSGVRAVISCGRAPAAYVYFRRLIDVVMRQVLM